MDVLRHISRPRPLDVEADVDDPSPYALETAKQLLRDASWCGKVDLKVSFIEGFEGYLDIHWDSAQWGTPESRMNNRGVILVVPPSNARQVKLLRESIEAGKIFQPPTIVSPSGRQLFDALHWAGEGR